MYLYVQNSSTATLRENQRLVVLEPSAFRLVWYIPCVSWVLVRSFANPANPTRWVVSAALWMWHLRNWGSTFPILKSLRIRARARLMHVLLGKKTYTRGAPLLLLQVRRTAMCRLPDKNIRRGDGREEGGWSKCWIREEFSGYFWEACLKIVISSCETRRSCREWMEIPAGFRIQEAKPVALDN